MYNKGHFTADPVLIQQQLKKGTLTSVARLHGVSSHTLRKFITKHKIEYLPKPMNKPRRSRSRSKRIPVFKVFPPLPGGELPDEAFTSVFHKGRRQALFQVWILDPAFVVQLGHRLRPESELFNATRTFLNWINDNARPDQS